MPITAMTDIDAADIRLFEEYSQPRDLRRALRRLDRIAGDRQALVALGDAEAITGATVELQHALLDVLAVPPTDVAAQEAKNRAVAKHFDLCDPAWLLEAMMAVATRIEWRMLDLTPEQEKRIRAVMPKSRISRATSSRNTERHHLGISGRIRRNLQ